MYVISLSVSEWLFNNRINKWSCDKVKESLQVILLAAILAQAMQTECWVRPKKVLSLHYNHDLRKHTCAAKYT